MKIVSSVKLIRNESKRKGELSLKLKRIIFVALVFITVFSFCGCQQNEQSNEISPDTKLQELKIGVDTLVPYFYTDENGNFAGIDAEIATEACRRAGYSPDFIKINWDNRDQYLQNGTVDCLWTAFIKDGKEDSYLWTDTYLQSNLRVIIGKNSPEKDIYTLGGARGNCCSFRIQSRRNSFGGSRN